MSQLSCFVIEPTLTTNDADKVQKTVQPYSRVELDRIYNRIIAPSLNALGFRIIRSSQLARADSISRDHIEHAQNADLLVVNMTSLDPLVFFCVAHRFSQHYRENGYGYFPIIAMIKKGGWNPFYIPGPFTTPVEYDQRPAQDRQSSESGEDEMDSAQIDFASLVQFHFAHLEAGARSHNAIRNGGPANEREPRFRERNMSDTPAPPAQYDEEKKANIVGAIHGYVNPDESDEADIRRLVNNMLRKS